jgi:NAD(P)H dehydrogenase (quinone)
MNRIKAAIIYYSSTGANYQMAQWAEEGAREAGAETRLRKVAELAPENAIASNPAWKKNADATKSVETAALADLEWADVFIFSAPTRYGNLPAQMKQFLDSAGSLWVQGKLANKIVTAMSSAQNVHGGQEATILNFYTTMYHWGAIVVAPGYTDKVLYASGGNPYGTSGSVDDNGKIKEDIRASVMHQARRAVTVGMWLRKGSRNGEDVDEGKLHEVLEQE